MALSNKELRKQLKDALADQVGIVTSKLAANQALSAAEKEFLQDALADQEGQVSEMLAAAIGTELVAAAAATAASYGPDKVAGMATNITLSADNDGPLGHNIILNFNGVLTINAAISAWNAANPSNTLSLDSGVGTQVPDNGQSIRLAGGTDAVVQVLAALDVNQQKLLKDALADQIGELTAKLVAGDDFSS